MDVSLLIFFGLLGGGWIALAWAVRTLWIPSDFGRAGLRPDSGRCGECDYDLTGLSSCSACPECGTERRQSYFDTPPPGRTRSGCRIWSLCAVAIVVAASMASRLTTASGNHVPAISLIETAIVSSLAEFFHWVVVRLAYWRLSDAGLRWVVSTTTIAASAVAVYCGTADWANSDIAGVLMVFGAPASVGWCAWIVTRWARPWRRP